MTVAELKEIIKDLPSETAVLIPAGDHGYITRFTAQVTTALVSRDGWTEDFGEIETPESHYGKRTKVLVIR